MKISASLFFTDILPHKRNIYHKLVKSKIFDDLPPKTVFSSLKKAGLEGVELILPSFQEITDENIYEVKKVLDENAMPVLSVHQVIRFFKKTKIDEIVELFHVADLLSAKVIVLHMSATGKQVFDKAYIKLVHSLQRKYGITVGFENRENFFSIIHPEHQWHENQFAKLMGENNFNITLDTTHLGASGGDICNFFEKNKDRIINIHLSDYKPHLFNKNLRPFRFKHLPLGKGILPIEKFLKLLKKEKYEGLLTMEISADLAGICECSQIIYAALERRPHEEKK